MAKNPSEAIQTPVSELEYVRITGDGKKNSLNGKMEYSASLVLDPENNKEHAAFIKKVDDFWTSNKPAKYKPKEAKSNGLYPHKVATGEKDEDGDNIYEETGKVNLVAKTGTTFPDGSPKVIKIFNAKGAEVNLNNKMIGNDSRGRLGIVMSIYTATDDNGRVISAGITFYLNTIQLAKFVEYAGAGFDALEDEEDAFEGVGDMGGIPEETSVKTEKPRLD